MSSVHAGNRDGQRQAFLTCARPGCGWEGDIWYTTRPPHYCTDACRQKAYRERKRARIITQAGGPDVTHQEKDVVEKAIDMTLHLMKCPECERSIWTVMGNVKLGKLVCGFCNRNFRKV